MGDLKSLMSMIPGAGKMLKDVNIDDKAFGKVEAIIHSMTPLERSSPEILNMSRKTRIANGSGKTIHEVNAFIKQFEDMRKMMFSMSKGHGMNQMMNQMKHLRR
jgi:signal recognition particle subunit SRP54